MFGSVHPLMALEFIVWLRRARFDGHVYFDTFPRNEDPVREAERNIRAVKRCWARAVELDPAGGREGGAANEGPLQRCMDVHDALGALDLLQEDGAPAPADARY